MKNRLSSFLLFAIACLASCKNNDNVFAPVISTSINVVNASADTINYYLNGTRQNNASSLFPGGATLYITEPAGLQNYQFKKKGASNVLFSFPLTLTDSVNNSIYVTTENSSGAFNTVDILIPDTVKTDTAIMQFRFVNAAPDAGALSISIGNQSYFSSVAYKSSSTFSKAPSGAQEVKIYTFGTSTPAIDTTLTFTAEYIYTIFSKGLLKGTGNSKLSVGLIANLQQ